MTRSSILAFAVAALFTGPAAAKVTINGVTLHDDGTVSMERRPTAFVSPPHLDKGLTAIYDDIGHFYPKSLYFCCVGWGISGVDSVTHAQSWIATPFTPNTDLSITRIDIALQLGAGTNKADIGIFSDSKGLPGTLLKRITVSGLTGVASCCGLVIARDGQGIPVSAGQQYWLAVMTNKHATDTFATWLDNTTDEISAMPTAGNTGSGWEQGLLLIPHFAYAIYGK